MTSMDLKTIRKMSSSDQKKMTKDALLNAIMESCNDGDDDIATEIRKLRVAQEQNTAEMKNLREGQEASGKKLDAVLDKFETMESTISDLRRENLELKMRLDEIDARTDTEKNEVSVIMSGLTQESNESPASLREKVDQVIESLGEEASGLRAADIARMKKGKRNKPGLVKITLNSKEEKITLLRAKRKLENTAFKDIRIWGSRPLAERIASQNFRSLLKAVPGGENKYFVSANGRILEKRGNSGNTSGDGVTA